MGHRIVALLLSTALLLAPASYKATASQQDGWHLPPTDCSKYVADVTIPDWQQLPAGGHDTKTWQVTNCGSTTWTDYQVVVVYCESDGGPCRGVLPPSVALPPLAPGETGEVSLPVTVPNQPGKYKIWVETATPDGHRFGDVLWLFFTV